MTTTSQGSVFEDASPLRTNDTVFTCPLAQITHLVLDVGYASRLNEHIPQIDFNIKERLCVDTPCLFTFDPNSMPRTFVPCNSRSPREHAMRKESAENILSAVRDLVSSVICFEMSPSKTIPVGAASHACFDIIDIVLMYEHCPVYSNVTRLHFVKRGDAQILVLGYDFATE
jgi:hypothetical protein